MSKRELAQMLYNVSYLRGEFLLRSGQTSNEYFDKYQFESRPEILVPVARELKALLPPNTEVLGALEMGGIPIATALAIETGLPLVFVRKKAKQYGTCRFAEGCPINGKIVTLIEDVVTTGGQVVLSAADLRSEGALIDHVLCVLDRSGGRTEKLDEADLTLHALFKMDELKVFAEQTI